ncbi:MAG: pilus assembly protein PilM [Actinobacteria bacterium]|nr:pilus assembly protein PilM [Actinomycetota bacterium]
MQLKLSNKKSPDGASDSAPITPEKYNGKRAAEGLVGLDVSATGMAAARVLDGRVRTASITGLAPEIITDGEVADPAALGRAISEFFEANGMPKKVRMGVASPRVVIRTIELPPIEDRKQLDAAVRFQAAEHIPMPLDEAVIDHQVVRVIDSPEGQKLQVLLVAASRGLVDSISESARRGGIKLQGIDLSAFALIRVHYPGSLTENETLAYVHFGDMVNVTLAEGQICKFTRATANGYEAMLARLRERVNLTHEHAQMWADYVGLTAPIQSLQGEPDIIQATREELAAAVDQLSNDVTAAIDFHTAQETTAYVSRILFSGPGSSIPGIAESLAARTGLAVEIPAPLGALDVGGIQDSGIDERRLTLAAGLALEQVAAL